MAGRAGSERIIIGAPSTGRGPASRAEPVNMSTRNVGAVALVILIGLGVGALGLVAADLYAVGVLILFLGAVGVAVVAGDWMRRYLSRWRPPT